MVKTFLTVIGCLVYCLLSQTIFLVELLKIRRESVWCMQQRLFFTFLQNNEVCTKIFFDLLQWVISIIWENICGIIITEKTITRWWLLKMAVAMSIIIGIRYNFSKEIITIVISHEGDFRLSKLHIWSTNYDPCVN